MAEPTSELNLSRGAWGTLVVFGLVSAGMLVVARGDYPHLHTMLDTGMWLLSGVLALLLWDIGSRSSLPFAKWLAVSFAVTSILEMVHALVSVEWSGPLAWIAGAADFLRPATWPPTANLLPIGIGASVWALRRGRERILAFTCVMVLAAVSLFVLYFYLPRYTPPTLFGVTRPTLVLVPVLWAVVGWMCWRWRVASRKLPTLALMSLVLAVAHAIMLYSRAPHDTPAMVAHLGKVSGYLVLLLSLMRMASDDMLDRIKAERALADLNQGLEVRVKARTAELEAEMAVREAAERKVHAQLEHLNLLHHITRAIGERQDLNSIFQVVVRSLEDQLPLDFCCVCLYDRAANELIVAGVGVRSEPLAISLGMTNQARVAVDANGLSRCVTGQLVYEPDVGLVPFPFCTRLAAVGLRSLVAVALQVESQVMGVLIAARTRAHAFSSGECEFLGQLAEHAGLAIKQSELYGALQLAYDDLRQAQQIVVQQERLRALGQMASGIAHDINNAISPVTIYAQLLLDQHASLPPRVREDLEIILRASEDVAHTVVRLREFSKQRDAQSPLGPVQLNELVNQVLDLTKARWSDIPHEQGIEIRVLHELETDLPGILGQENEIREALTNLVLNAVDAMSEGGTLTLRTRRNGQDAYLEVSDTGPGMDAETRQHCLEPFFTTKGDQGTGLGLAMVFGIAQRHDADIEIDSAPGLGTTVRICFPIPRAIASPDPTVEIAMPRRLHLLVVDDDPVVLRALREALEMDGHAVVTASGGQAGIEAFRASQTAGEPFAAVITDLGMPHTDGRKVAAAVKNLSSATPVILLTGWGQRMLDEKDLPASVDRVLSKPPRLRELRAALVALCPG